jgi:uncharacterized membrane protein
MQKTVTQPLWKRALALVSITVWMVWGYIRLMPPPSLIRHGQLVASRYDLWSFKNLAYSDVVKLYETRYLFLHLIPYIHNRIEYPVITGIFMSLAALGHGIKSYFFITFIIFWLIAILVYFVMERLVPEQAIFFAVLPLLMVYGLLNWDVLGIGFMVVAWYLYQRHHYTASAVVFCFGVFAKLFPVFFLPFIIAELVRKRELQTLWRMVGAFFATTLIINVPFAVGNFKNWSYFFTYNAGRGLGADIYANEWIHGITTAEANLFSLIVVVLTVLYLMWQVYRGARVIDATALSFTVFLFVNKVYSPQYTLWVFVLAILAEWPIWTYIVLTLAGLVDYVNSFTVLYLLTSKSSSGGWYVGHVFFVGVIYRYITLAVVGVGSAIHSRLQSGGYRDVSYKRVI